MKNMMVPFVTALVLVGGVGTLVAYQTREEPPKMEFVDSPNPNSSGTSQTTYTALQVAEHSSPTSCWAIINGNVYDLTSWIPQHPGGPERITQLCGTDGSEKFNNQHGGMTRMETILAGFKIGILAR